MTLSDTIKRKKWRRSLIEVRREFNEAKEQLAIFGHPANRPECEAYYQYWRGVRNALMWVLYNMSPIRSDGAWETEPRGETKD